MSWASSTPMNVPGIFAAGDLRLKFANQIVAVTADGTIAASAEVNYVEMLSPKAQSS